MIPEQNLADNNQNLENSQILDFILAVASTENTPELVSFWQNKYQKLWIENWFSIDQKIIVSVLEKSLLARPITPIGLVNLQEFINPEDQKIKIDELEETVETSVRLLDAIINAVNFETKAKDIVEQYRKIGLGVKLPSFKLSLQTETELAKEIALVAYRTSEHLAEEKGQAKNWLKINRDLQDKSYEYWFNSKSGELVSASEMYQKANDGQSISPDWQIVARRNSHLLALPEVKPWSLFNDRKPNPVENKNNSIVNQNQEPEKSSQEQMKQKDINNETLHQPDLPSNPQEINSLLEHNKILDQENQFKNQNNQQLFGSAMVLPENNDMFVEKEQNTDFKTKAPKDQSETLQSENNQNKAENYQEVINEPLFQEGELVKTNTDEIAQVLEGKYDNGWVYKIKENIWLPENELKEIEVGQLLEILNQKPKKNLINIAILDYFEPGDSWFCDRNKNVPFKTLENNFIGDYAKVVISLLPTNKTQTQQILSYQYNENEIWLIYRPVWDQNPNFYQKNPSCTALIPAEILNLAKINTINLNKNSKLEREKIHNELMASWNDEKNKLISRIKQETILEISKNKQNSLQADPIMVQSNNIKTNNLNYSQTMSKYTLKLEQLVKTNAFGDLVVNITYDDEGPKIVSLNSGNLNPDLRQTLDTFLMLVNFTLAKKIAPSEIATLISTEPKSGNKLPINDLLKVIGASLKDAPENADGINGSILGHVTAEMVTDVMQSISQGKPVDFNSQPKQAENNQPTSGQIKQSEPQPQPQSEAPKQQEQPRSGMFNPFAKNDRNE